MLGIASIEGFSLNPNIFMYNLFLIFLPGNLQKYLSANDIAIEPITKRIKIDENCSVNDDVVSNSNISIGKSNNNNRFCNKLVPSRKKNENCDKAHVYDFVD